MGMETENQPQASKVKPTILPRSKKLRVYKDSADSLSQLQKALKNYQPKLVAEVFAEASESPHQVYKLYQFLAKNGWKYLVEFGEVMVNQGSCQNFLQTLVYML
jgi:hypothetical protein